MSERTDHPETRECGEAEKGGCLGGFPCELCPPGSSAVMRRDDPTHMNGQLDGSKAECLPTTLPRARNKPETRVSMDEPQRVVTRRQSMDLFKVRQAVRDKQQWNKRRRRRSPALLLLVAVIASRQSSRHLHSGSDDSRTRHPSPLPPSTIDKFFVSSIQRSFVFGLCQSSCIFARCVLARPFRLPFKVTPFDCSRP